MSTLTLPQDYSTLKFSTILVHGINPSTCSQSPSPRVVQVVINRLHANNAFTQQMALEIRDVYALFDVDERVRCIILTGAGDKFFCAGADLNATERTLEGNAGEREQDYRDGGGIATLSIHACRKPTIAALSGHAVGIGITLTLPCALRIVSSSSKIGFVFARRGLTMEACSSFFLPRLIGYSQATRLVTTGEVLKADHEAFRGLWTEVVQEGGATEVRKRAYHYARMVSEETSIVAGYVSRSLMWHGAETVEGAHLLDSRALRSLFDSPDKKEGIQSFMEKRDAKYTGTLEKDLPDFIPWWHSIDLTKVKRSGLLGGTAKL